METEALRLDVLRRGVSLWLSGLACVLLLIAPAKAAGFPVTSIAGVSGGWVSRDVTVALTATPPDGAMTWYALDGGVAQIYAGPLVIAREGTSTLTFWSRDGHSAMEDPGSATVRIDKTAPVCAVSGLPDGWLPPGRYSAAVSAADALSGVADVFCRVGGGEVQQVTGPVAIEATRSTWVEYWAEDDAGNLSVVQIAPVRVADGRPLTWVAGVPVGWSRSDVSLDLKAEAQDAPVATTLVSVAGAPARACVGPVTVSDEGVTRVAYRSIDALGRAEATRTIDVAIDRTPPVSHVSGLPSGVSSSAVTVGFDATDAASGVAGIRYSVDGESPQWAVDGRARLLGNSGPMRLEWWALDVAGNEEEHHRTEVAFDTVAPVTTTDVRASYSGTATILLGAADAPGGAGVASTWHRLDAAGSPVEGTTVVVSAPGSHALEYWSIDSAGNVGEHQWRTFTVDAAGESTQPTSSLPPTVSPPPPSSPPPTAAAPPVKPPATRYAVSAPRAPSSGAHGRTFTVSGLVSPRLASGAAARVEMWRRVSGRWRLVATVRTSLVRISGATRYSVRVRLTHQGRWRARAYAIAGGRRTYGAWSYFRVR